MSNDKCQIKRYPLLPFSQLVYEMTRWTPRVYRFPFVFVWKGGAKEKEHIEQAVCAALANHPVFQMRLDWWGRQFASPLKDILHGPYHVVTITETGEDLLIQGGFSRVLGDGVSLFVLMEDISCAYYGEALKPDDYWGYLEYVERQKQSKYYADNKEWFEREFFDESIPVHPTLDGHRWTLLPPKSGLYTVDYSNLQKKINQLAETEFLSMDGFFSLCVGLAIAEYCGTDSAALTWAYEGRERHEEQRIFGSLHRDIPFVIKVKGERLKEKGDLIRQARNQVRSGIAHSDYPYTLTAPYNKRWNYAVNVLRVTDESELVKLLPGEIKLLPSPPQKYAYALLDVEIHESAERLEIVYRYSASHYKRESIKRFASLVRKYAEWLLEDEK